MSVSTLPLVLGIAAVAGLISLGIVTAALLGRRSLPLWLGLAILVISLGGGYSSYVRLERIHGELFRSEAKVKTKQELIARFGLPSRRETYIDHGRKIEVLFYDITLLSPPVHTQFQFYKEEWIATVGSNQ